jgi:hypothetical protein
MDYCEYLEKVELSRITPEEAKANQLEVTAARNTIG